ncbi:MAG: hypothetical protein AAF432_15085 [Planctomycetota bacterium]
MSRRLTSLCLTLVATAALIGCGSSTDDTTDTDANAGTTDATIQTVAWMLPDMPADSVDVLEAKSSVSEGDNVVIRGVIGGRVDALSEDSAFFVMIDATVNNPCLAKDDHCKTPWDYCCTPRDEITKHSMTVKLVGDDGRMMPINLKDHGIAPLDTVVIVGTVAAGPEDNAMTVTATGIHRVES